MPAAASLSLPSPVSDGCAKALDLNRPFVEEHLKARINSCASDNGPWEDSFYLADVGVVYQQYARWTKNLKRVRPFFGECTPPQ